MTHVIRDDAALAAALPALGAARRVALDTEFHTERHYHPRLMLIQVRADDQEPLIIDALAGIDLTPLARTLETVQLVVHGGLADVEILHRLTDFSHGEIFDTQVAAGCAGDGWPVRLQELAQRHLAIHMDKAETLSDWSRRPLSPEQVRYAKEDVLVLAPLMDALVVKLAAFDSAQIARDCTQELYARAIVPADDDTAWRNLQAATALSDTERGVARALAAWRESNARAQDVPRHQILSDSILVDLARRQPRTIDAIRGNRRMPSQVWKRDGDAILACIDAGLAALAPALAFARDRPWRETVWAAARISERARGVAAELMLPEPILEKLSMNVMPGGWRREALGQDFESFFLGHRVIRYPGVYEDRDNS